MHVLYYCTEWNKKPVSNKNRITFKLLHRLIGEFIYVKSSLCSRYLQMRSPGCRHILIMIAMFSNVLHHFTRIIAHIATVIAVFRPGIVSWLMACTLSLIYQQINMRLISRFTMKLISQFTLGLTSRFTLGLISGFTLGLISRFTLELISRWSAGSH